MYTRKTGKGGAIEVSNSGTLSLTFEAAKQGPPDVRQGDETSGGDAEKAASLGRALTLKVRAQLPYGALNNEMRFGGRTQYLCEHPKWKNNQVDTMFYELARLGDEQHPTDFVFQMAALAWAARTVGAGVCSMIAHVGLGELTTFADAGTDVALVVDQNFDHSYLVVGVGRSTWFSVDPWVGQAHVVPWSQCYFPREDVSHHFRVRIHAAVGVPYGVEFTELELSRAKKKGDAERQPGVREMDHHYVHETNVAKAHKHRHTPVMNPSEWGDGVGRAGKGGPFDIFG